VQALIEKGLVKANNFRNNANKRVYLYLLTPRGLEEKARVTARFLRRKLDEYETLKRELQELQSEAAKLNSRTGQSESSRQLASDEQENRK
jgi:EPS-associated MarR family transcriptional regulator